MFSKALLTMAVAAAFSTVALAEMPASPHQIQALAEIEDRFKQMDIDGDGQLSKEEGAVDSDLMSQWSDLDNDLSESLNWDEFSAHQLQALALENETRFKELDSNADGQISQEEADQHTGLSEKWADLDQDQNNNLSQEEFSMFQEDKDTGQQ